MRLYDIHAHLADTRIRERFPEVLASARAGGVAGILVSAARIDEWEAVLSMSRQSGVRGALGIHPFFSEQWCAATRAELGAGLASPGILAVGEIGLDFLSHRASAGRQATILAEQLLAARDAGVPVVLHNRKAWPEFFGLLRDLGIAPLRGVCHHFTGSRDIARRALDAGLHLSVCGPVTYPNARRLKDIATFIPEDRLLTETDTPDLAPEPFRGRPSEPAHVRLVLEELARLRGVAPADLALRIEANVRALFPGLVPEGAGSLASPPAAG